MCCIYYYTYTYTYTYSLCFCPAFGVGEPGVSLIEARHVVGREVGQAPGRARQRNRREGSPQTPRGETPQGGKPPTGEPHPSTRR